MFIFKENCCEIIEEQTQPKSGSSELCQVDELSEFLEAVAGI